ncbi:MAG: ABC transporter permease, partial [Actinomycetia bacterium]|nr:ABC transporter permease [Actinomycetes bacterium]
MGTILKQELRRTRFSMILWSAIAGLIIFFGMLEYPALAQITGAAGLGAMQDAIAAIPVAGQLVFGVYNVNLGDPIGYYIVMYYWVGLIVFTHAMYTGASMVAKETRDKTAEFLFTKPYPRQTIVGAKILAALVNLLVVGL